MITYILLFEGTYYGECKSKGEALMTKPKLSIDIHPVGNTQKVIVSYPYWVSKSVELPTSYSLEYSYSEILNEIADTVAAMLDCKIIRALER